MSSFPKIILLLVAIFFQGYFSFTIMVKHRVIVQLTKYENPGSKRSQNRPCDNWFGRKCDYRFEVCLGTQNDHCRYYRKSYRGYHNAPDVLKFQPKITFDLHLANLNKPLVLYVRSYDEDIFSWQDSVDTLFGYLQLNSGRHSRYIEGTHTKLFYDISVICNHGWHGPYCNQAVCLPGCNLNRGYCNGPDQCLCQLGWQGRYCNQAVCRRNCHSQNGYCNQPNECRCRRGWTGRNCDIAICRKGCSPYNGYCQRPFDCRCNQGWTGPYCSTAICKRGCHPRNGFCQKPGQCLCKQGWIGENCDIDLANRHLTITIKPINISLAKPANETRLCKNVSHEPCVARLKTCLIIEEPQGIHQECEIFSGEIANRTHVNDTGSYRLRPLNSVTDHGNNWRELRYNLPSKYYCLDNASCKPLGIQFLWMTNDTIITSMQGFMAMERLQLDHSYNMQLIQSESQGQTFISYSMHLSLTHIHPLLQEHKN